MTLAVLAFGQSNMGGYYGPAPNGAMMAPTVNAWNYSSNAWVTANLGAVPFHGGTPTPNNLAYVACKEIARHTEQPLSFVLLAGNGLRIEYFMPNIVLNANGWTNSQTTPEFGSSLSEEMMGAGGDALTALASLGKTQFDLVLMHQGEANTEAEYADKLEALFQELDRRNLLELGTTPIVLGEINPAYGHAAQHAAIIAAFAAAHSSVGIVNWDGYISTVGGGNFHADGAGLEKLGVRYANASDFI